MAEPVSILKAQVEIDASKLKRGSQLTKSEFNKLRGTFRTVESSQEKLRKQTDLLNKAYKDGTIDIKQRHEALKRLQRTQKKSVQTTKQARGGMGMAGLGAMGGRALGAIGVGMSVRGTAAAVQNQADYANTLGDTAQRLGMNLETLQVLQVAAVRTGVSVDTLSMALQRQTRRVAEAAKGTGEAVKALEELGLNARELNRMQPGRQFEEISAAIAEVPNRADQVRLAMKLFDSEGVALVNTLDLGKKGFADLRAELSKDGGLITQRDVDAARDYNEEINKLSVEFQKTKNAVGSEAIPVITAGVRAANQMLGTESPSSTSSGTAALRGFFQQPLNPGAHFQHGAIGRFQKWVTGDDELFTGSTTGPGKRTEALKSTERLEKGQTKLAEATEALTRAMVGTNSAILTGF